MRFRRHEPVAEHFRGKAPVVPDTLSISPLSDTDSNTSKDVGEEIPWQEPDQHRIRH